MDLSSVIPIEKAGEKITVDRICFLNLLLLFLNSKFEFALLYNPDSGVVDVILSLLTSAHVINLPSEYPFPTDPTSRFYHPG